MSKINDDYNYDADDDGGLDSLCVSRSY